MHLKAPRSDKINIFCFLLHNLTLLKGFLPSKPLKMAKTPFFTMTQLTFETHLRGQKLTLETKIFTRSQTVPGEWSAEIFFFYFFFTYFFFNFCHFLSIFGHFFSCTRLDTNFFFHSGGQRRGLCKKIEKKTLF